MQETLHAIATPRGTIRGMMHLPETEQFPLCCLFHGFQGNRIGTSAHLVDLARTLCRAGMAVARFDFIGSGESDGEFEEMSISGELEDLYAIVDFAGRQCGSAMQKLFLIGHSMGGSVAGMAAGERLAGAAGLILLTPAGEVSERISDSMSALFEDNDGEPSYPVEINGQGVGEDFKRDAESLEMLKTAAVYRGPVLLVTGGQDEVIPPGVTEQYLELFPGARHLNIDECDHSFRSIACRKELHREVGRFILEN